MYDSYRLSIRFIEMSFVLQCLLHYGVHTHTHEEIVEFLASILMCYSEPERSVMLDEISQYLAQHNIHPKNPEPKKDMAMILITILCILFAIIGWLVVYPQCQV